jgi:hypothetical protein
MAKPEVAQTEAAKRILAHHTSPQEAGRDAVTFDGEQGGEGGGGPQREFRDARDITHPHQLNKLLSLQSVPCSRGAHFVIESHRGCLNDRDTTLDAERRSSLQGILKPPSPATSPALQGVRPG